MGKTVTFTKFLISFVCGIFAFSLGQIYGSLFEGLFSFITASFASFLILSIFIKNYDSELFIGLVSLSIIPVFIFFVYLVFINIPKVGFIFGLIVPNTNIRDIALFGTKLGGIFSILWIIAVMGWKNDSYNYKYNIHLLNGLEGVGIGAICAGIGALVGAIIGAVSKGSVGEAIGACIGVLVGLVISYILYFVEIHDWAYYTDDFGFDLILGFFLQWLLGALIGLTIGGIIVNIQINDIGFLAGIDPKSILGYYTAIGSFFSFIIYFISIQFTRERFYTIYAPLISIVVGFFFGNFLENIFNLPTGSGFLIFAQIGILICLYFYSVENKIKRIEFVTLLAGTFGFLITAYFWPTNPLFQTLGILIGLGIRGFVYYLSNIKEIIGKIKYKIDDFTDKVGDFIDKVGDFTDKVGDFTGKKKQDLKKIYKKKQDLKKNIKLCERHLKQANDSNNLIIKKRKLQDASECIPPTHKRQRKISAQINEVDQLIMERQEEFHNTIKQIEYELKNNEIEKATQDYVNLKSILVELEDNDIDNDITKEYEKLFKTLDKAQKDYSDFLISGKPSSLELTIKNIKALQTEIDKVISKKEYLNVVKFAEAKDRLYSAAIDFIQQENLLKSLSPTMKNEMAKNKDFIYDVSHLIWVERYDKFFAEFEQAQKDEDFELINTIINQFLSLIGERIILAENSNVNIDIIKYTNLIDNYSRIGEFYELYSTFCKIKNGYREIEEKFRKKSLTTAMDQSKKIIPQISQLYTKINARVQSNSLLVSLLPPLKTMKDDLNKFQNKIAEMFEGLLVDTAIQKDIDIFRLIDDKIPIPKVKEEISHGLLKIPLFAKIVVLGDSSVGKTHLILTLTGGTYNVNHSSTLGVDIFFRSVKSDFSDYDAQLCFWDLSGQQNYRNINELFINDSSLILLLYDVSNPETFIHLNDWLAMIRMNHNIDLENVFIVGNKVDVGESVIKKNQLKEFLTYNKLNHSYHTSAKTEEGTEKLLVDIAGRVDWNTLVKVGSEDEVAIVGRILKEVQIKQKIIHSKDLKKIISDRIPDIDQSILNAILRQYASQKQIQFGKNDKYIVLDPLSIDKFIAKIINIASDNEGVIKVDMIKNENEIKLPEDQIQKLMDLLTLEQQCYIIKKNQWIFPHVNRTPLVINDSARKVLDSNPLIESYPFKMAGSFYFSKLLMILASELSVPSYVTNDSGLWWVANGNDMTAVLIHLVLGIDGETTIQINVGGCESKRIFDRIKEIISMI